MIHNIQDIEGMNSVYAEKLIGVGITNVAELLEKCSSLAGIEELEQATSIEKDLIIQWVNFADLSQIKGVDREYFSLLSALGIHTISELKNRFPETLHYQMMKLNHQKQLVQRLPSLSMVRSWVAQATNLQRKAAHNNVPTTKLPLKKWSIDWSD
ncbi:MAG: DUF4332 domain-containing protein [Okeania sp. SIO2C2]|uniref:DUF4332 domain-containing protein n=1 Tax=Okeania sp. SIO2C2 TaxID=2607787 RepID=UPI0013B89942|nr:DUF4332 domain-containing protein [Okeania sp. SIO2C2]NEP86505.1 DUF4332 domain-containing protein [Okeania sp. SIO2C2]